MKSEKTKELIERNFLELLAERPISEISVNAIAEKSGLNRNTFYYHFKNVPDLLESVTKRMMDQVILKDSPRYESLENCITAIIKMAEENKKIIYHIYNSSNRKIFERHLWHVIDYSISLFAESFGLDDEKMTEEEREILRSCFKYVCFGFIIDWINNGMNGNVSSKIKTLTNFFGQMSKND